MPSPSIARRSKPRDTDPRGSRADEDDAGVGQARPEAAHGRQHARDHDCSRALDVVVERRDAVPVAIEDPQGVRLLEVLPLDDAVRPDLGYPFDEGLDKVVVRRAAQTRRAMADIEWVGEQGGIVGADVERHRQRHDRVDPTRRGVQRELADRDGHPAGALVAETEDPLVVGDDDQPDVLVRALAQELRDAVAVRRGDPGATRPPDDVAELLAGAPDGRRVDDRQELGQVLGEQPVEQRRIPVLERGQTDVALERVVLAPEVLELELDLLLDRQHPVRQQPSQIGTRRVPAG